MELNVQTMDRNDGCDKGKLKRKERKNRTNKQMRSHFIKMLIPIDRTTMARKYIECFNQYNSLNLLN